MGETLTVENHLTFCAKVTELQPLRKTPAGLPVIQCILAHASRQVEAGIMRDVSCELQAVALGDLANILAAVPLGTYLVVTGFLSAKSLRSRIPVLHLKTIEFQQGN